MNEYLNAPLGIKIFSLMTLTFPLSFVAGIGFTLGCRFIELFI